MSGDSSMRDGHRDDDRGLPRKGGGRRRIRRAEEAAHPPVARQKSDKNLEKLLKARQEYLKSPRTTLH